MTNTAAFKSHLSFLVVGSHSNILFPPVDNRLYTTKPKDELLHSAHLCSDWVMFKVL